METLERQVQRARRRLILQSLAGKLAWCWFLALLAAAVAIALGKLSAAIDQRWWAIGWLAAATVGGAVAAGVWTWLRRQSTLDAALEIDRRWRLGERISSTLALDADLRASDAGQALTRDAERSIRGLDVAEQFGWRLDRRALLPPAAAALAFALAALVPVRAPEAPAKSASPERAQMQTSTRSLAKKIAARRKEASAKGLDEIDPLLAKLELGTKQLTKSAPNDRKKTLLALNDLVKDVERRRNELSGVGDLKKQLAGLKDLRLGPAEKFGKALARGDMNEAIKQLEQLKQRVAANKLDAEGQKALAKQLDQLQQALQQKVEAHEQMAQRLRQQIEAERRAGNLAAADKMQKQLDRVEAGAKQMKQLAEMQEQLENAAQCMGRGDCESATQALANLGGQLQGLDENLQEMEFLDDALDQFADCKKSMACNDCNGQGCKACQGGDWQKQFGQLDGFRQRGGGKGIGVGLGPGLGPETDPDGKFYDSAVKQQPGRGPAKVVGQADGPNRKGRVRQEIQTEFSAAAGGGEDALSEQRLPRDYRDHAKKYFDALRDQTE